LKISVNKAKAIGMKGEMNVGKKIVINNSIIEQINSCNYIGYTITVSNCRDSEINVNIINQTCIRIRRTWNNKKKKEIQIKFYKVTAVLSFRYGSEISTATKKEEAKIETAEIKFWRRVAVDTRKLQIKNTEIRK
jgi:hypothetical protein